MNNNPKTTIWENTSACTKLVKTRNGIPYPTPKQGELVYDPEFGETICSGTTKVGSDDTIIEVKLTIK